MSDPHEREGMSVTLKHDGKEGTWIVFHGSPAMIREQMLATFPGLEATAETPLYDIVNEATRMFKASGNVTSALGGRVIPSGNRSSQSGSAWDSGSAGNSDEPKPGPEVVRLTAAIEAAEKVEDLHDLYARNKAAFDENADLMSEWKAKGKALS